MLKGLALAQELYGDISHRTSSDLDILVPIDDLEQAEILLIESGYQKDDYIHSILNDWKWRHHHFSYYHPEENIKIELHWRLNPGLGREPHFDELWKKRVKSGLTQSFVYLLGKEDIFMFLSSHGARHGWSRLRWLLDLQYLMKQKLDEKKLA